MKKSIKYAGIAAATLLAVAPVAAPVVSQADVSDDTKVTTTNADDGAENTGDTNKNAHTADATALSASLAKFDDKFGGTAEANDILKTQSANLDSFTFNNKMTFATFMADKNALVLSNSKETPTLGTVQNSNDNSFVADDVLGDKTTTNAPAEEGGDTYAGANVRDIFVTGKATLQNGSTRNLTKASELKAALTDSTVQNIALTTHYTYTDTDNNDHHDGSTTLNIKNTDMALSQMNVTFTTPYNVSLNQTVTDSQLIDGTDFKITDQNGDGILTSDVTPSTVYYTSARAAATNDNTNGLVDSDAISTIDTDDTNNSGQVATPTFKKAGSYYQALAVSFKTDSAADAFLKQVAQNPNSNVLTINGVKFGDINTDNYRVDTTNHTITFARKIVVSSDSAQWTTVANKGVVTTKTAKEYYTLNDTDGKQIKNRALSAGTPWITDQKRTDQNGNVQYRVATGEWIDANDVTFSDKVDNGEGAYTGVTAINGKVTLDGPNSFVYFLYDDNGVQLKNRAVNGDSAWYTDKKATNADDTTVYRVATGEWLQAGSGAHYSAY